MTDPAPFVGGCLCGAVRYRSTAAPVRVVICHCSICRRHSGAPALALVLFPAGSFLWIGDEPARYRSSRRAERGFCRRCGSTLSMHEEAHADTVQVALGSLDEPERVRPDDHVWTGDRIPWFEIADDLPRYPRDSPESPGAAGEGEDTR